jgi:hypothetical protein
VNYWLGKQALRLAEWFFLRAGYCVDYSVKSFRPDPYEVELALARARARGRQHSNQEYLN